MDAIQLWNDENINKIILSFLYKCYGFTTTFPIYFSREMSLFQWNGKDMEKIPIQSKKIQKVLYPLLINYLLYEKNDLTEDEDLVGGTIVLNYLNEFFIMKSQSLYNSLIHPQSFEFNMPLTYLVDYICDQLFTYEGLERNFIITILFMLKSIDIKGLKQCEYYASIVPSLPYTDCILDFYERTLESKFYSKKYTKVFLGTILYFKGNPKIKMTFLFQSPLTEIIQTYFYNLYV